MTCVAEIAWHESRRKWVGDQSQRPDRMVKDPIIRYSRGFSQYSLCTYKLST